MAKCVQYVVCLCGGCLFKRQRNHRDILLHHVHVNSKTRSTSRSLWTKTWKYCSARVAI